MAERRKRRTAAEVRADRAAKAEADQARVVLWADTHGAPLVILEGWDPDSGQWATTSPLGQMIALVRGGNFVGVAASYVGLRSIGAMIAKGREYAVDVAEDRAFIPIDIRPFIDLVRQIELAEAGAEFTLVKIVRDGANTDPKMALAFLARRFGQRWREQQTIFTSDEVDERDKAISDALTDPNIALQLADTAHAIEDRLIDVP